MKKTELNAQSFIKSYWNYFLELEQHVVQTQKYVDFDNKNNSTFSIEYLKLLQAICSEVDVVSKAIAQYCNPAFKIDNTTNINKWGLDIQSAFPKIQLEKALFSDDYVLEPWINWEYEKYKDKNNNNRIRLKHGRKNPIWWTAYNKVKHERTSLMSGNRTNYTRANLKNVLLALSGLFILENIFIDYICEKEKTQISKKHSSLFRLQTQNTN